MQANENRRFIDRDRKGQTEGKGQKHRRGRRIGSATTTEVRQKGCPGVPKSRRRETQRGKDTLNIDRNTTKSTEFEWKVGHDAKTRKGAKKDQRSTSTGEERGEDGN